MGLATSRPPSAVMRTRPRSIAKRRSSGGTLGNAVPASIGSITARMRGSRSRFTRLSRCVSCRSMRISLARSTFADVMVCARSLTRTSTSWRASALASHGWPWVTSKARSTASGRKA
ncbi:hypothetical protein BE20_08320 [Sorangium cellulosum]|nr:hypothetical protein BE20_08320 [Sorangium cellulosum]